MNDNKITFRHVVKNYSQYPIDIVWENAKDLEHVGFLHPNTNQYFELLKVERHPQSMHEYDVMIYRTLRKLIFFRFQTFGFRKIIQKFNLQQIEYIPLFGITNSLNSLLYPSDKPGFKTLMQDEVVMEIPRHLSFLVSYFKKALERHTAIQCQEDEPFRARRQELAQRQIKLPFSIFNESTFERLTRHFQSKPFKETDFSTIPFRNELSC